jgi:hypothetical protein
LVQVSEKASVPVLVQASEKASVPVLARASEKATVWVMGLVQARVLAWASVQAWRCSSAVSCPYRRRSHRLRRKR